VRKEFKTAFIVAAMGVAVLVVGTLGYMLIEDWGFLDSFFMTITTIFTVGFGEVHPLSRAGMVLTIVLIIVGVGVILYSLSVLMEFVIGGQLSGVFRRRAVKKQVDKLEGHFIICGYGRVGSAVAQQFQSHDAEFVVVDIEQSSLDRATENGFLSIPGDASSDEVLEIAGVRKAKGLVAAMGSDAQNIFVTLSARVLNPALLIVARASSEESVSKLERAGADHVVTPYDSGGKRMATLMLKPVVSDYLEVVAGGGELEFRIEEFELTVRCCATGQSIGDLDVRKKTGATILAVRHGDTGAFDTNPSPTLRLAPGDTIIAIGMPGEILRLEELVGAVK